MKFEIFPVKHFSGVVTQFMYFIILIIAMEVNIYVLKHC